MKNIIRGAFALYCYLLMVSMWACQQSPSVDPKFKNVQPGPPMQKVQYVQAKPDSIPPKIQGQKSNAMTVEMYQDNRRFEGSSPRATGKLEATDNTLRFTPSGREPLEIRLRLPDGVSLTKSVPAEAVVEMRNESSPAGAAQYLRVESKEGLVAGSVWQVKPAAQIVDLGKGFKLVQTPLSTAAVQSVGYTPVVCHLISPAGRRELKPGETIELSAGNVIYQCVLEISSYFKPSDPGEDGPEGYILKAGVFMK